MKATGGWSDSDRESRLPANWRSEIVPAAFAVWGDRCHLCGRRGADSIDHLVPGDDHSMANLRPAHLNVAPFCHRGKSSREGHEAQARRRAQARMPREQHPGLR